MSLQKENLLKHHKLMEQQATLFWSKTYQNADIFIQSTSYKERATILKFYRYLSNLADKIDNIIYDYAK